MKGDRERVHRRRRLRLHHQAGRHRPAALADARVALPVEHDGDGRSSSSEIEIELLLEGIYRRYGFDFREYAPASLQRRLRRRMDGEKVETISALQDLRPARPGGDGAAAARPVGQRHRDVPRPELLPRVPREGRAAAAHLSVHADLGRRLLDRRGGLLARDPARRGGPLRPRRGSTRPTSTRRCSSRRGSASSRWTRCRSTRRTTSAPAARARSPSTTSRATTARCFARGCGESVVFAQHNLVTDASFNEFNVILCRNVMIYFDAAAAGPRAPALLRQPGDVRRPRARAARRRSASRRTRTATRSSTREERLYRKVAHDATS